ncbi:amino acid adenylation domain-containing protein [Streptomyces sp. NPDC051840]|uniref:amino acid adenylation domain-containing protein n=1 Tax=Streptomyces sp. NPDC051840 TaxID=3154752 RepID=UPI003413615B
MTEHQASMVSFGQERLLWLHEADPTNSAYHLPLLLEFDDGVDRGALRTALARLVARHDTLGARYLRDGEGTAWQVRVPGFAVPVRFLREGEVPADDTVPGAEGRWERLVSGFVAEPFAAALRPPVRAAVVERADGSAVLALVLHHLTADGPSLRTLSDDLVAAYEEAAGTVRSAAVRTPGAPFTDFARQERDRLAPDTLKEHLAYWRERLAGTEPVRIGVDGAGPASTGREVRFDLSTRTTAALERYAVERRSSLTALLAAAYQGWLAYHSGRPDVTVALGLDQRRGRDFDRTVGFFVQTLALRADVRPDAPFDSLVRGAQHALRDARRHYAPFEQVMAQLDRPGRRDGVVNAFFVHHGEGPAEGAAEGTARVRRVWLPDDGARFDVELNTILIDGRLHGGLRFRSGLLDAAAEEDFAARFPRLLRLALDGGDRPLLGLPLAGPGIVASRPPSVRDDLPLIVDVLGRRIVATPDATALVGEVRSYTYGEFGARVARLAHLLLRRGIRPEDRVAILSDDPVAQIIALYAVLAAGGVYVPLDPAHPATRNEGILGDAGIALLLVGGRAADGLDVPDHIPVLAADAAESPGETGPLPSTWPVDGDRAEPLRPTHAAYIIHTSGSTGRPKGVVVEHRQIATLLDDLNRRLFAPAAATTPHARPRAAMTASMSFDVSWQGLLALAAGCETYVALPETRRDIEAYTAHVRACRPDLMDATPTHVAQMADAGLLKEGGAPRVLIVAGEALPPELWERLAAAPATEAWNYYGPTEATVYATAAPVVAGRTPAIGQALDGVDALLLDDRMRPVPAYVRGEIHLAGPQLARGYLARPGLTAERFHAHPHGAPGARVYRTGDIGYRDGENRLVYEGRSDSQVKLRGYRIELGEIEAVLSDHPRVRQAVVIMADDGPAGPRLLAFATCDRDTDATELRSHAARRLPAYMVPARVVVLSGIPLTTSGKLDRAALLTAAAAAGHRSRPRPARRRDQLRVRTLCGLFTEVLGLPAGTGIQPDDDFFALGGHSLLVTRLRTRVRAELGCEVGIRDVFDHPTPRALAARLGGDRRRVRPPLVPGLPGPRPPLSAYQQGLWFIARSEGPSSLYNIPVATRLTGPLDTAALTDALGDLVARHPALRTVYPDHDGLPGQRVLPPEQAVAAPVIADTGPDGLAAAVDAAVRHPFDPTSEPPLRTWLLRGGPEDHVLLLVVHHLSADGGSLAPLLRDLGTAYTARAAGNAPELPQLPLTYLDYAAWHRAWLGDATDPDSPWSRQRDYWAQTLAGLPEELPLPCDGPRDSAEHRAGVVEVELDASLHRELTALAADRQAGLDMVFQTAVAVVLHRCGAGTDIPLGGVVSTRGDEALHDVVGYFVNTLVHRHDLSGTPTCSAVLDRVRATCLAARDHADLPFESVVETLNPTRLLTRHPLFQTAVLTQLDDGATLRLPGVEAVAHPVELGAAKFDLCFTFRERRTPAGELAGVLLRLEYRTGLYGEDTARALADAAARVVRVLAERPGTALDAVGLPGLPTTDDPGRHVVPLATLGSGPEPAPASRNSAHGGDSPAEQALCGLFAELLDLPPADVGPSTGFFAVGGHSLLVTRLVARVRTVLGADISIRDVFETPTPAGLAARLAAASRPRLEPGPRPQHPPLSPAQRRLWFVTRAEGPGSTYNIPVATRLTGALDTAALACALGDVIRRHEPLRTVFPDRDGVPHQHVLEPEPPDLPVRDTAPGELADALASFAARPLDPARDTPLRAGLLRLGPDEHVLTLVLHHIAGDGWSMGPLLGDLSLAYAARTAGSAPEWPPLQVTYTDYALWQQLILGPPDEPASLALSQQEFWRHTLGSLPPELALPYDRPRPSGPLVRAGTVELGLPAAVHRRLTDLAASAYASTAMALHAGVATLLHLCGAGDDIPVGGVVSGRTDEALGPLVGFFVNTQVLRHDLSGAPDFTTLLTRARETALAAYDHQDLPFERVVELVNPVRSVARHPLFQTMVLVQPAGEGALRLPGVTCTPESVTLPSAKFDLTVTLRERFDEDGRPAGVTGRLDYAADLFDHSTAETMARTLERLLDAATAEPGAPVATLGGALDAPAPARTPVPAEAAEPRAAAGDVTGAPSPGERAMRELFAEILGVDEEEVGGGSGFFDLGGHSLLVTRLIARTRTVLGHDLTVRDVFEHPTPAGLARLVAAGARGDRGGAPRPPLLPGAGKDRRRPALAPIQQGLWFLQQFDASGAYNVPYGLRLRGPVEPGALGSALHDLAERHDALRTLVRERAGLPVPRTVTAQDLRAAPLLSTGTAREEDVEELVAAECARPFDLSRELPLRAALRTLGPGDHVLVVVLHHLAVDGGSMAALWRDLAAAYRSRCEGRPPNWPPPAVAYADYAAWSGELLGTGRALSDYARAELEFWRANLAGLPAEVPLPRDHERPDDGPLGLAVTRVEWGTRTLTGLDRLAVRARTSRLVVAQALVAALLTEVGGGTDIALGTPVGGRTEEILADVVGHFVNTVVVRVDTSGAPAVPELVRRTRDAALAAFAHQTLPFDRLVQELSPPRRINRNPLYQVMVTWQRFAGAPEHLGAASVTPLPAPAQAAKFDLTFDFGDAGPVGSGPGADAGTGFGFGFGCRIGYAPELFDQGTARTLAERLHSLVEAAVSRHPEPPVEIP